MIIPNVARYYEKQILREIEQTPEYRRVRPKNRWRRIKQSIGLERKQFRAYAKKGYFLSKDFWGRTIQLPLSQKQEPSDTVTSGKTITFTRHTDLDDIAKKAGLK